MDTTSKISMEKKFDIWNEIKKQTDERADRLLYKKREIRWCKLGVNVGYEQDGTGEGFSRPVLIIKDFNQHVCLAVPLTTSQKKNPYHVKIGFIDGQIESSAIISQLRLIDTKRLYTKVTMLDEEKFNDVIKAIKDML
jgi:mRNA interferase MazF